MNVIRYSHVSSQDGTEFTDGCISEWTCGGGGQLLQHGATVDLHAKVRSP